MPGDENNNAYGLDSVVTNDTAEWIAGQFPDSASQDLIWEAFEAAKAQCAAEGKTHADM
ncbi:MAG: hypothetical protein IT567_06995, partial [Alphaproteobacteria bacterium]|nr:hypothetical protein [Alphaproteobacteria bacterium]